MPDQKLRQVTLSFLLRDGQVLLAMKKRGFGVGHWNGVGGKPNPGESIEEAAKREAQEEIGVRPTSLEQVATLNFYFPHVPEDKDWNQSVIVFLVREWEGEPTETEEMRPQWFDLDKIPFDEMWADDRFWLRKALEGEKFTADCWFTKDQQVEKFEFK